MQTFEELAAAELDALYQGALFLEGGDDGAAERLLVSMLADAFDAYRAEGPADGGRWLIGRLVRAFMDGEPIPAAGGAPAPGSVRVGGFGTRDLFQAAAALPAAARAALWLVLLQRWSYAAAAEAVGVDRDGLVDLLQYGHVLMASVVSSSDGLSAAN